MCRRNTDGLILIPYSFGEVTHTQLESLKSLESFVQSLVRSRAPNTLVVSSEGMAAFMSLAGANET
jgi:hypothetical protein